MKLIYKLTGLLMMIVLIATLSACQINPKPKVEDPTPPQNSPEPTVITPYEEIKPVEPSPEPPAVISPDPVETPAPLPTSVALTQLVNQTNEGLKSMADQLQGIFKVSCEARGSGSMAIIFQAQAHDYESIDIINQIAESVGQVYSALPQGMLALGITEPSVIIEFLDMDGAVVFNKEFTLDSKPSDVQPQENFSSPEEALALFVEAQQNAIPNIEAGMNGYATISIEARGTNAIAYVFNITENAVRDGVTNEKIRNEMLPELKSAYEFIVPTLTAMGIVDATVIIEFNAPDGSLIASTEIK